MNILELNDLNTNVTDNSEEFILWTKDFVDYERFPLENGHFAVSLEYDDRDDTFCVYNLNEFKTQAEVTLLGEEYIGIEDLETGAQYTTPVRINPQPRRMGDSASCRPEPLEKVFELPVATGDWKCFKLLRK